VLSYVRTLATRAGVKDAEPSRFLADAGVPLDDPDAEEDSDAAYAESLADALSSEHPEPPQDQI
jgi:hypothetical protein